MTVPLAGQQSAAGHNFVVQPVDKWYWLTGWYPIGESAAV